MPTAKRSSISGLIETGPISWAEHPILSLPLSTVIKPQIALMLRHLMQLHSVGAFLNAWRDVDGQRSIEQLFDSPQQARHAVTVCATWLGLRTRPMHQIPGDWWIGDECANTTVP
jgi:hypothetical protein